MHMSEKLRSKTSEMQAKVNQMADQEKEMQALINDFDLQLAQINEIEEFNKSKIEKIGREMHGINL